MLRMKTGSKCAEIQLDLEDDFMRVMVDNELVPGNVLKQEGVLVWPRAVGKLRTTRVQKRETSLPSKTVQFLKWILPF